MISFKKITKSIKHALSGLHEVFEREHSFRVQIAVFIVLLLVIIFFKINGADSAILILVAVSVLVLELANSVFERFLDIVSPRVGIEVKEAKDIMAGAVLVASVSAVAIGAIIIMPYLLN